MFFKSCHGIILASLSEGVAHRHASSTLSTSSPSNAKNIFGLGLHWDNGKESGNYKDYRISIGFIMGYTYIYIIGLPWDTGKEKWRWGSQVALLVRSAKRGGRLQEVNFGGV